MLADAADGNGMIHLRCSRSVTEIVDRLESVLKDWGTHIFARIDHSLAAAEAGISMQPMQVLLFGNPAVGTPMMIAAPTLGIDLPSKVLAWEDEAGTVWLTYNTTEYLKNRHGIPVSLVSPLNGLTSVLGEVAKQQQPDSGAQ